MEQKKPPELQKEASHYRFGSYAAKPRFCSYWHQLDEVSAIAPESLLVVGVGDGIVPLLLKHMMPAMRVETFDFDPELKPTITGDVREIASYAGNDSFGCILCSQVLEHLPYENFVPILRAFSRIAPRLVLSIPCQYRELHFKVDLPKIHTDKVKYLELKKEHFTFNGEHYWEAGTKNYPLAKVRGDIASVYRIGKEFRVPEKPWHLFFVLERK
ncbi:MAG: class I SAM-dependent methyltransferase [Clostridia bacterium]|nr:class I SAM-dependent methyltransferase [Clostridia bacterium]